MCCYLPKGREITSQRVGKESFVIRIPGKQRDAAFGLLAHLCRYETQNNMPLPLCYLLIESLCQICCIAVSIKYKLNSARFENISPYQNSMHTDFSIKLIEESPRE